jgi:hypothetical protein
MPRSLWFTKRVVFAICAWLAFAPAAHADVQFSLRNGRVTLVARDATLRQILAEWSRVGKIKVVNLERIPGGPLTLELRDVPEGEALDILLRTLSGYIAAPRTVVVADASMYDSISIMPTLASPAVRTNGAAPGPAPFTPVPVFNQNEDDQNPGQQQVRPPTFPFPATQAPQPGNPNVVRPVLPVVRPGVVPAQPNNNPNDFPAPVVAPPFPTGAVPAPAGQTAPGAIGVPAPGMIAPAPASQQPGQVPQQRPPGD